MTKEGSRATRFLVGVGLPIVFLALLAAAVLAQANPFLTLPNTDGGYNLYAGSQILKGRLPYVDFWNTKGPGIYYLNALGLYLGHGLRWGVWGIEYTFLLSSIILLFVLLRRQWGLGAAAFGLSVAMIGLNAVLNGGNLTEEYSLVFNAIALYVFWREGADRNDVKDTGLRNSLYGSPWVYLLIGCVAGISFSFRANNIGVPVAIGLAVLIEEIWHRCYGQAVWKIALIGAGFAVPVLIGVLYFWLKGALPDYLGAVYFYNVRYAGSRAHPLSVLLAGFQSDKLGWPAWVALAGAVLAVVGVIRTILRREAPTAFALMLALVLWIEIGLSSLSWRMFGHYFITWMPAVALLSAYLFAEGIRLIGQSRVTNFIQGSQPALLVGGLILCVGLVSHAELGQYGRTISQILFHRADGIEYKDYMSNYVDRHTQIDATVLTWPGDAWINFASRRDSPVRLVFYPMFDAGTITPEQGKGYLDDLAAHKPALIIDCADMQNEVPSLDPQARAIQYATRDFLFAPPYLQQVFDYVSQNYHVELKTNKCTIYRVGPQG